MKLLQTTQVLHRRCATFFLIIGIFVFSFGAVDNVYAQTGSIGSKSLSGDEVCGASSSTRCTLGNAKAIVTTTLQYVLVLGTVVLGAFIIFRFLMAWKARVIDNNPNELKQATKQVANAIFGFLIIAAIIGGIYVAMLKFLGVDQSFLKLFTGSFIDTAYAQGTPRLVPNPISGTNSLYDLVLLIVRLFVRWFVYPAIVALWVWTGFSFVTAQGRPEELKKAKSWLLWAVGCTVIIFMTESFLFALRGTVNQILPNTGSTATPAPAPIYQPAPGTTGASCTSNGQNGMIDASGACVPTGRGATPAPSNPSSCAGRPAGTVCSVMSATGARTGICGYNQDSQIFDCYSAAVGDMCLTSTGAQGQIGANYQCETVNMRPLTQRGGSCQVGAQCQSGSCVSNVCQ
jgi:phosphatidylglycerophosphatase A